MANRTAYYHGLAKYRSEDIKPFKVQEPQVWLPAGKSKILSVGISRMTLSVSAVNLNLKMDRMRLLSDKRVRVLRQSTKPAELLISFDLDALVDSAKGQCIEEIERALTYVGSLLKSEVSSHVDLSSARVESLTAFRRIVVNDSMSRLMSLLFLLSENRPTKEYESLETQPGVPCWSSGSVLIYDQLNGAKSADPLIVEYARYLSDEMICVEVRMNALMLKNLRVQLCGSVAQNLDRIFRLFGTWSNEPFDCSQKHVNCISVNGLEPYLVGLPGLSGLAKSGTDIRPFKEQENCDIVLAFVKQVNAYGNAYDGFPKWVS